MRKFQIIYKAGLEKCFENQFFRISLVTIPIIHQRRSFRIQNEQIL